MTETGRFRGEMVTRELQICDLAGIQKLLIENLQIEGYRVLACLIHFVFNLLFKSLGLDTIFGSVTQSHDGKIVGLIITRRLPLAKTWIIGPIAVDKRHRGFGIGTSTMKFTLKVLQDKKADGALISVDNTRRHYRARKLFQKFGFRILRHVFTSSNQAYSHARMISLREPLNRIIQESISNETDLKNPQKIWYIFLKKF